MQTFEEFREKTINWIDRNNTSADTIRIYLYSDANPQMTEEYIQHRNTLKKDEEFLEFFKNRFNEDL